MNTNTNITGNKPDYILNPDFKADSQPPISHVLIRDDKSQLPTPGQGMSKAEFDDLWEKTWADKTIPEI